MAIQLQTILDTYSLEGGRVVTNDNFSVLQDLANRILLYLDSDFGLIKSITSAEMAELKVATNKLVVNSTSSTLNDSIAISGDISLAGHLIEQNILSSVISNISTEVVNAGGVFNIGSASQAPTYYVYKITSADISGLPVYLYPGEEGQKLKILFVNDPTGDESNAKIYAGGVALLYLPPAATYIQLDEIGESIDLIWIEDGWYITGGYGYTVA